MFRATVPLVNEGPGLALDTVVTVVADSAAIFIQNERLIIGTVQPGEFAVTLDVLVGDSIASVTLLVEVQWSTAQSTTRQCTPFEVLLMAQKPDIPWEDLEADDPYSTEVAHGDEFVGRKAKVTALAGRLRRPRSSRPISWDRSVPGRPPFHSQFKTMCGRRTAASITSSFIWNMASTRAATPRKPYPNSVIAIAARLLLHLPPEDRMVTLDFAGSIAQLNQLAQHLITLKQATRFVIILDEFDEIHPEMYRYGPLAEAFFSNLRTLSAKPNIALMLIGGENMPFIIGAQGDQLNKFVREQLSYFSRSSEWGDYVDLVTLKNTSPLTWYESAVAEIFRVTNGHPYYTKLLRARVFQTSVLDRDTEVTIVEVDRAVRSLIEGLDTNAFAHF